MAKSEKILERMRESPTGVRFADLARVCEHFFGEPRQLKSSPAVDKTPWQGDPRVNIQNDHGEAKAYQVRQVLAAIEKLNREQEHEEE